MNMNEESSQAQRIPLIKSCISSIRIHQENKVIEEIDFSKRLQRISDKKQSKVSTGFP